MFVDFHTHVFHPRIAEKAKMKLAEHYKLFCRCKGTPEDLLLRAGRCGIDHCVALCAATSALQVRPCNAYAGYLQNTFSISGSTTRAFCPFSRRRRRISSSSST